MKDKLPANNIIGVLVLCFLILALMVVWSGQSAKSNQKNVSVPVDEVKLNDNWSFPIFKDKDGLYTHKGGTGGKLRLPDLDLEEIKIYGYYVEAFGEVGPYLVKDDKTALIVSNGYPYNTFDDISSQIKDVKSLKKLNYGAFNGYNIYTDGIDFYYMLASYWTRLPLEKGKLLAQSHFIKDDKKVFYFNREVRYADAKTFEIVKSNMSMKIHPSEINFFYAKDKNRVYYKYSPVNNADPETFTVYDSNFYQQYARDNNHVYFEGNLISEADPETFKVLRVQPYEGCSIGNYGLDKNYVYFETNIVKGANPKTFEGMWNGFGRDDKNSYFGTIRIDGEPQNLKNECDYG